jgi:hypothetical protein
MKVRHFKSGDKAAWNRFLETSKNSHFMFNRDYMEYHADRFSDFSLIVSDENDDFLALLPSNISNKVLYSHQGLTFGGLCVQKSATTSLVYEMFRAVLAFLKETNLVESLVYKRLPDFYVTYPAQEDLYSLFLLNAKLFRRDVSVAIDLESPLEINPMRMRRIKKAQKLGVLVEEATSFLEFWDVLEEVLQSQHGVKPVHSLSEIERLRALFPKNIRCFTARKEGKIIAGTVVYETAKVAHTQYLANTVLGRELGALDLVLYELITNVYGSKKYFDFGISNEEGGRVLNAGLISQKEGFGARALVHEFYSIPVI